MNRRNLLKALTALPFVTHRVGENTLQAIAVEKGHEYIIFVDERAVDIETLANIQVNPDHPLAGAQIIPVYVEHGKSVQDTVAIYELPSELAIKQDRNANLWGDTLIEDPTVRVSR